jgi:hypothetical protein
MASVVSFGFFSAVFGASVLHLKTFAFASLAPPVISSGVFHFFAPYPPHIPHRLGVAVSAMVIGSHYFSNQAASQVPNPLHIFPFCFSQFVSSWIATPSFPSQFRYSLIASSFFPRNYLHR